MSTSPLSQKKIDFYHTHGYLQVDNVISAEDLAELRRVTDEFVEKSRQVSESDDLFDLESGHTAEEPRLRRLKRPRIAHPIYDSVLRSGGILDVVARLIGDGIRTNGDKLNMKSAEFGSPVEWHQDFCFYPHTNDDLLAVGIPLEDMTEENGCLLVVPGSHKIPLLDHHQDGAFVGAVTDPKFDPTDAVPLEINAGGVSIHHARTLHGSAGNTSGRSRRLYLIQYAAVDAFPLLNFPGWDEFNERILRGEPTFDPRLAPVPVRIPFPIPGSNDSIYDHQSRLKVSAFRNPGM
jgi:ectoine hydroxylase-related dioxygenase (phytanoyl-CoA dioxygenase family)